MPCCGYEREQERNNAFQDLKEENSDLRTMLCSVLRTMDHLHWDYNTNPMVARWWEEHKRYDAEIERTALLKENKRKIAIDLSKKPVSELTQEDKKLLREEGFL
jgi:hypothetical protein